MNDKMREEFEEAVLNSELLPCNSIVKLEGSDEYSSVLTGVAWLSWKASRAALCINACAGMDDQAAEIAELKRQRDELLGLVKAVSYHSIPATVDGIKCAAFPWSEYESMVKKAKGSAS